MVNIIIKNIYSEKFEINVETYDTISKLKKHICIKLNIPKESFILLFQGYHMIDEKTIFEYKIVDGSIIHMLRVLY
jgi:hypothetical protein